MMKNKKGILRKLSEEASSYAQFLPGIPIVEIAGDKRVLIENHSGITEYSPQRIAVKVSFGCICICGNNMDLSCMSGQQLVIGGRIDTVSIIRGGSV